MPVATQNPSSTRTFLGIRFWNGAPETLLVEADRGGGLFTCPSAPSLAEMRHDRFLRQAYEASDWSVVDGGYVALVLRLIFRYPIVRISGLQVLQRLLGSSCPQAIPFHERRILWVVPNVTEKQRIQDYLVRKGYPAALQDYYEAPFYRTDADYHDANLIACVRKMQADWVVLCIGGGRQEKLGFCLRNALLADATYPKSRPKGPVILCTGGAIAFLTGGQALIPTWADRVFLGWFFRIMRDPAVFLKRYSVAGWAFPMLLWQSRKRLFSKDSE